MILCDFLPFNKKNDIICLVTNKAGGLFMRPTPLFSNIKTGAATYDESDKATYGGITIKTVILFLITVAAAIATILIVPKVIAFSVV